MTTTKKLLLTAGLAAMCVGIVLAQEETAVMDEENPLNAVVKLEVQTSVPDFILPWRMKTGSGNGSGVVIAPGRILTCAHCVADSTFIRVRKNNDDAIYHAKPLFIDNERDLALISVEDPAFMADVVPMELGETPPVQSEVVAVGYPTGGRLISFTRGIVSRIEDIRYTQGWATLLAAQVDAAINPGNSGGPVLDMSDGKIAGIAFQGRDDGELLGYMIPTDIIRCFIKDIADGRVDGAPDSLFATNWLESEAKRRYLKMSPGQTGLFVSELSSAIGTNVLHVGDVLLEVDGHRVANNGDIRIAGNRIRSFHFPVYMRQIGEDVPVKVLRDGKIVDLKITAGRLDMSGLRFLYDQKPDYFVCGGLVFTSLSFSYLTSAKPSMDDDPISVPKDTPDSCFVMLSAVLADVSVEGYLGSSGVHVRHVNGVKVRNLRHLVKLIDENREEYLRLGIDDGNDVEFEMVLDTKQLRDSTPTVLERYGIPADRSPDLAQ